MSIGLEEVLSVREGWCRGRRSHSEWLRGKMSALLSDSFLFLSYLTRPPYLPADELKMIMSSGSVPVIDLSKCPTPHLLANAVFKSLSTVGFLFITNHGLENQVEDMFTISGESTIRSRNEAS